VRSSIEAVLPLWLDRPDLEALEIAEAAGAAGLDGLWIGEMATFDAFALAAAIGARVPGLGLRVGPLPISVRTPVSIALGASSVAALTGCEIDVALGASSPFIVAGWHDRDWSHSAARMRETIECLRPMLRGERGDYDGRYVNSHGFRLRNPLPQGRIGVGAFGPTMMRLAAEIADEVVLNLASPQRVSQVRQQIEQRIREIRVKINREKFSEAIDLAKETLVTGAMAKLSQMRATGVSMPSVMPKVGTPCFLARRAASTVSRNPCLKLMAIRRSREVSERTRFCTLPVPPTGPSAAKPRLISP